MKGFVLFCTRKKHLLAPGNVEKAAEIMGKKKAKEPETPAKDEVGIFEVFFLSKMNTKLTNGCA